MRREEFLIFLSLEDRSFEDESFAAGFELGSRLYFAGYEIRGDECSLFYRNFFKMNI